MDCHACPAADCTPLSIPATALRVTITPYGQPDPSLIGGKSNVAKSEISHLLRRAINAKKAELFIKSIARFYYRST